MPSAPAHTLIIQTAFLGDLLLSIPLIKKTRELWPDDPVVLMCREKLGEFFLQTGLVDQLVEIRKGESDSYEKARTALSGLNLARVISPHTSVRTALFVRSLNSPEKMTFKKLWNFPFFDRRVPRVEGLPDALRQLNLLSPFDENLAQNISQYLKSGRAYKRDEDGRLSAPPTWASMSLKKDLLENRSTWGRLREKIRWPDDLEESPVILIFPGSVWATKRWTEEGFVEVGRALAKKGATIFVMGAGNEIEVAGRVASQIPGAQSLAGKTALYESAQLLAHANLMIGNDSASIHLASVTETPLVSVFGPTVIEFGFRPWSADAWIADLQGLSCRPCGPHGHKKCPRGTHECMKNLSAGDVLSRVERALR